MGTHIGGSGGGAAAARLGSDRRREHPPGSGAIDVKARATAAGGVFETIVETGGLPGVDLTIGHVVPGTARIAKVVLNGDQVPYHIRMGHRGQTVLVRAPSGKRHHLYVLIV